MRTMTRGVRRFVGGLVALLIVSAAGCDDDGAGVDPDHLEGVWTALEMVAVNVADTSETEDITALGGTMVVTIEPGGLISVAFSVAGVGDAESGTYLLDGDEIEMILDGDPVSGTWALDGNLLTMSLDQGVEWDFGGDGIDVPARLDLEFVRVS